MLLKGNELNAKQRSQVLAAFVHRWTFENRRCESMRKERSRLESIGVKPALVVSDANWIANHAFHFLKDGSQLMASKTHAEPEYMANSRKVVTS